jgi:hypothetical protein
MPESGGPVPCRECGQRIGRLVTEVREHLIAGHAAFWEHLQHEELEHREAMVVMAMRLMLQPEASENQVQANAALVADLG